MDINSKIQAASHSGASLKVRQENSTFIVEKIIDSPSIRDKKAIIKQRDFSKLNTSTYIIESIPIISFLETEKKMTLSMPYIEGIGGDVIANKGTKIIANNIKVALNSYLLDAVAKAKVQTIDKSIIIKKLDEIEAQLINTTFVHEAINITRAFCTKDLTLPVGQCHGDLTLSNMKISENHTLYLFDFLNSYIESPLQDAVKLIQDMVYGWSFRKQKSGLRLKGLLFCEAAYPNFIDSLFTYYPYEMKLLEIMTLLRIAPYIKADDHITTTWLEESLLKSSMNLKG